MRSNCISITILSLTDSYEKALERAKRAEETSNMESNEEGSRKRKRTNLILDSDSENGKTINRLGNRFFSFQLFCLSYLPLICAIAISSKILIERLQLVMKVTVQTLIQRSPTEPSKVCHFQNHQTFQLRKEI